jgi:N-acetyl-gamma-glutamyl-phosphate reductase
LNRRADTAEIQECYHQFFAGKTFVRIYPTSSLPEIKLSAHTNFCDLGFTLAADGRRLILVSCLDNLLKGAAGQAIQNMNLMHGWAETEGLR